MADKKEIQAFINTLGIEYVAEFVPQSKSRNANDKHHSLNWRITVKRGNSSLVTDYMQGIGHLENYSMRESRLQWYDNNIKHAVESGTWNPNLNSRLFWKPIPAPSIVDVFYSLALDSDVLDYATFEEWAENFGYDVDSRNAEKMYKACIEITLKLRSIIGNDNLEKLKTLYQDY